MSEEIKYPPGECRAIFVSKKGMSAIVLSVCAIIAMVAVAGFTAFGETREKAKNERHQNEKEIAVLKERLGEIHSTVHAIKDKLDSRSALLERIKELLEARNYENSP